MREKSGPAVGRSVRIAWLLPILERGYYWQPLFHEFSKLFPSTTIFTSYWQGFLKQYEGTFSVRLLPGYRFITLKRGRSGYDRGFMWVPPSLLWALFRFRPRVIFAQGFSIWTLYALLFKALTRCRLVLLWEGTSPNTAYADSAWRLRLRRTVARFFDACVSNTQEGVDYLRDVLRIPERLLLRQPHEVPEISLFSSSQGTRAVLPSMPRPIFLFVGSLIERKGWSYLLEAVDLLAKRGLRSFSTVFAGTGPEAEELRQRVASLGVREMVHLVGQIPYENLVDYFQACDVFVLPTLEDTWAMVVLEAMACGKAVLCSKYAGAKELVESQSNGFVFDPYDPSELAGYMELFVRRPDLITSFGARSKEIIAPYTPARAAQALATVATGLLARPLPTERRVETA